MADELAGTGFDRDQQGPHTRSTGPQKWQAGARRVLVLAYCCERCGSLLVRTRDNGRTAGMVRWECQSCGHSWKDPDGQTPQRVLVPT
jgi:transposase-like protein